MIFDYNNEEVAPSAIASESETKLGTLSMPGEWGAYFNYNNSVILFRTQGYEFPIVDRAAGVGRIQLTTALGQFNPALISSMVGDNIKEVNFGVFTFIQEVYIDVRFDDGGTVTEQNIRRECIVGVSATKEWEEDGKIYDVPIGKIYGCFDDDQVGAIGETLKMMFNLEMTIDEEKILEFINTRDNETIAVVGDDDYNPNICTCFSLYEKDEDGNPREIDCSEFNPKESLFPDPPELFTQIPNGNFDEWSGDPEMAKRWMTGKNAPFATEISKVTHDDYWAARIYHDAKTTTQTVFQTEPFTIFYLPPKNITLQIKTASTAVGEPPEHHFPEVAFKLACSPVPFNETVAQNIQYNWNATEKIFINDDALQTNTVNTDGGYLSTTIVLGDTISSLWKEGNECRLEVISGSSADAGANFDVIIDSFIVE